MKAQVNWLVLGKRNTSFYHASVINMRRMNRITSLKDSVGNCITKENEVAIISEGGTLTSKPQT